MTKRSRKEARGASLVESLLAILVLLLILFGCLQVFQLSLANMIAEYASFRGTRSAAVGFSDTLAEREALVKAVPASGDILAPYNASSFVDPYTLFAKEKIILRRFMDGTQRARYEYWDGSPARHWNYKCPHYGDVMSGGCSKCGSGTGTQTTFDVSHQSDKVVGTFEFRDYPLRIPMRDYLNVDQAATIEAETELTNYADAYLE